MESFVKIVVCIKQVPDTTDIKWTENNTIQREGVESIINPFDEYALETALNIKDENNAHVTAITMGPPQAEDILKKAIAMGADDAALISDKKFSGSDTVATSRTLAATIKEKFPDFDLIICGQFATDGDTAQTGPSIAQNLDIPQVTYVKEIIEIKENSIIVKKEVEDGDEILEITLPGLICIQKSQASSRPIPIKGYMKAQDKKVPVYNSQDIKLDAEVIGIKGSPTYVSKAFRPEIKKQCEFIKTGSTAETIAILAEKIKESIG